MQDIITLDYGSGGLKTAQLIDEILVRKREESRTEE